MRPKTSNRTVLGVLSLCTVLTFAADLIWGSVTIPFSDVWSAMTGGELRESWRYIIIDYRLPKAITALMAGIGLAVSGLLMQTLFRNPLAGPYVLGISSGASLGVSIMIMGSALFPSLLVISGSAAAIVAASWVGSFLVLLAVMAVAERLRDTLAILIVGLMFGSFASAFVSVLTYFSTAEQLQKFAFWSMGNLGNLSWTSVLTLSGATTLGLAAAVYCIKPLDALLLGENYATSLGIPFQQLRLIIIMATSILAGTVTAFAGPIAFVGLAAPHIARLLLQTGSHRTLFWATLLVGAIIMLVCDLLSQVGRDFTLPINAVTSIIGAPVVIWLLIRKRSFS